MAERYVLDKGRYQMPERFNWDETFELRTFPVTFNSWENFERERPETQPQPVRE
ncbi:hypothetical protein SAMN06295888_1435 [Desulfonatronum zhilinae]|nr:hypothetical protein SAMN06295888_1435 [Desulfonatronum zhilinae]